MKHGLSFMHLRDNGNNPVSHLLIETQEGSPRVMYATCTPNPEHPKDRAKGSPKLTRTILEGRLAKKPVILTLSAPPEQFFDVQRTVVDDIFEKARHETKLYEAAGNWLNTHQPKPASSMATGQ